MIEWVAEWAFGKWLEWLVVSAVIWFVWRFLPLRRRVYRWFTGFAYKLDEHAMLHVCVGDTTFAYDCWFLADHCLHVASAHGYLD